MDERFVLILVSLNADSSDLSGFVYPKDGYIEARQYKPDTDIRHGFYGTLWGQVGEPDWLNTDPEAQWKVVRIERNSDVLYLDGKRNFVKFRRGHVVFSGDKRSCGSYIMEHSPEGMDLSETVAGDQYSVARKESLFACGVDSCVETANTSSHAINIGNRGSAKTGGPMSYAMALGHKGEALALGEEGMAIGLVSAIARGVDGKAVCFEDEGHVQAGCRGIGVGLGEGCTGCGEEGSVLILAVRQGRRLRFAIGYVGEGLEPGVTYRLNSAGYFQEVKSPVAASA